MAGSSLWLVPPPSHPLCTILELLIKEALPSIFPAESTSETLSPHFFSPHLTLTSDISPAIYGSDPQGWLDSIPWPSGDQVRVRFETVLSQDVFYRRCYLKVGQDGVRGLAALARARGVYGEDVPGEKTKEWIEWWEKAFGAHVSLMYGSVVMDGDKITKVIEAVEEAGAKLAKAGEEGGGGWDGGVVWLVPTDRPIDQWKPIAAREL
ncbi:hypothetical protein OQA88_8253 [Cercophora sp. LCS_1]